MFLVLQEKNISMKIDLNGKRALVGGSTGGIGKAIAIELSKCGANVTLMARNAEKLKKTITELSKTEISNHNYLIVDFNDFNDLKMVMEDILKKNSIDILINNTQGPPAGGPLEKNITDYQSSFDYLTFHLPLELDQIHVKQIWMVGIDECLLSPYMRWLLLPKVFDDRVY